MITQIPERYRSRVLLSPQATDTGTQAYLAPTAGTMGLTIRAIATKGNAAALALSLKYADDAGGTNATAYPIDVPVFANGVRQTNGKSYSVPGASGNTIVDFCVDPATIPDGKFVGLSYANSNAATFLVVELIEDVAYRPTAT